MANDTIFSPSTALNQAGGSSGTSGSGGLSRVSGLSGVSTSPADQSSFPPATPAVAQPATAAPLHAAQPAYTGPAARPAGFVRTPGPKLPSIPASAPESSNLGRYITIGVIVVLVLLLIYQIASKAGLRSQVKTLENENKALKTQLAAKPSPVSTPAPAAPAANTTPNGTLNLITYPILYREQDFQKIAQTISVGTDTAITSVIIQGTTGKGTSGQLAIYEAASPKSLSNSKALVKQAFAPEKMVTNQPFVIDFKKAVTLKAGVNYVLVLETTKKDTEAFVAYRSATTTAPGVMSVFSRTLSPSGSIVSQDFSWQELPGYDLYFLLRSDQ